MLKIAIGGLNKNQMEEAIKRVGTGKVEVIKTTDINAVKLIKSGEADYYFGACNSGGGAAISILIAMLGFSKCATVAKNGYSPKVEEIKKFIGQGKVAFGMAVEAIDTAVPILLEELLK